VTTVRRATTYSDIDLRCAAYEFARQNLEAILRNPAVDDIFAAIPEKEFRALIEDDALQITSELCICTAVQAWLAANACGNADSARELLFATRCATRPFPFPPFPFPLPTGRQPLAETGK
jgi:BTB And C-terminal Kelch